MMGRIMTEKTETRRVDDMRDLTTGWEIPSENYCDQPYVIKTNDGAWLCVMTTGAGCAKLSGAVTKH